MHLLYERPQAIRLSSAGTGAGTCTTGSGETGDCYMHGNDASTNCQDNGFGAFDSCLNDGSTPGEVCASAGSGVV